MKNVYILWKQWVIGIVQVIQKKQVTKAWRALVDAWWELDNALSIINDFRYAHDEITKELLDYFSNDSLVIISSRRLKRTPSIIHKIKRSYEKGNTIDLCKMQDIGGCRLVFENIFDLKNFFKKINHKDITWFTFRRCNDYLNRLVGHWPKEDWYRGIHIIYEYSWKLDEFCGLQIELQLRTKLQHYWATAVEIIDLMNESKLKFWAWEEIFKRFFKRSSILFENLEGIKTSNRNKAKIKIKEILSGEGQHILKNLENRIISYDFVRWYERERRRKTIQWDMILEITRWDDWIHVKPIHNEPSEKLKDIYLELEKETYWDINKDIVYLSSNEIENAYPNYVGDASKFLEQLRKVI